MWLNSDSRVSFPAQFDTLNRKIRLEGEAYFKVKSNPRWPMYITCKNNVVVQVVGTEFNLTTYANDDNIKLLLVSGKLDILDPNNKRVIKVQQNEEMSPFMTYPKLSRKKGVRSYITVLPGKRVC